MYVDQRLAAYTYDNPLFAIYNDAAWEHPTNCHSEEPADALALSELLYI